jgi:hypothetical protein
MNIIRNIANQIFLNYYKEILLLTIFLCDPPFRRNAIFLWTLLRLVFEIQNSVTSLGYIPRGASLTIICMTSRLREQVERTEGRTLAIIHT